MAKSEVSPPPPSAVETEPQDCSGPDDEAALKVERLSTLNTLLVKQTSDARSEIGKLQSQIDCMSLDLEDAVVSDLDDAVVGVVMKETLMEVERKAVVTVQEVRSVAAEAEERKVEVREEFARVKVELGGLENEKELLRRRVEEMEREFARVEREKGEIERSLVATVAEREESQKEVKIRVKKVECLQNKNLEMEEALVMTKEELDRMVTEKNRLEEEKSAGDRKLEGFIQENGLVVANLKREISEVVRKKDELERARKAKEMEMEEALVLAKAELDCVGMEKRRVEEEKSLSDRKLEDFVHENNLVVANLKREMNEMTRKKDELEQINKAKELRVSELEVSNDKFLKETQRLQGEVEAKLKEIKERESFFNLRLEEITKGMDDLNRKLKEAVKEKDKVEEMKCYQELKILELQEEAKKLMQIVSSLEKSGGDRAQEISRLRAEKIALQKSIDKQNEKEKCLKLQIEGLQETKGTLEKEVEHLKEMVSALEKSGKDRAEEMLRLRAEKDTLQRSIDQQNEKEKCLELQIDGLQETKDTLEKEIEHLKHMVSLSEKSGKYQGEQILRLQDEKDVIQKSFDQQCEKERSLELQLNGLQETKVILEKEVEQLRYTLSSLKKSGKDQGEEILRLQDEKDVIQKSFDQQLEKGKSLELQLDGLQETKDSLENELGRLRAMVDEHSIAEKEKESMKQEIIFLKNSVADANRKGTWAWISSATTVVAAVAYAVKNH